MTARRPEEASALQSEEVIIPELVPEADEGNQPEPTFSQRGERVVRCVSCIVSRYVGMGQTPEVYMTELTKCTGLSDAGVKLAVNKLASAGVLRRGSASSTMPHGGGRPATPYEVVKDQRIFVPTRREGCNRRGQDSFLESLSSSTVRTIAYMAHRAGQGLPVTTCILRASGLVAPARVVDVVAYYTETGILCASRDRRMPDTELDVAPRGFWLADEQPVPQTSNCDCSIEHGTVMHFPEGQWPVLPPMPGAGPTSPAYTTKIQGTITWIKALPGVAKQLEQRYPKEASRESATAMAAQWHASGVIGLRQYPDGRHWLWYTPSALNTLSASELAVMASVSGLGPLLYGRRLSDEQIRHQLGVGPKANIVSHVTARYVRPLMQHLATLARVDEAHAHAVTRPLDTTEQADLSA